MPNIKSAKKRVEVTKKKTLQNKVKKSALRTTIKKYKLAATSNAENKAELLSESFKAIDKAVARNLLHKNTAARKKAQLAKALA